VHCPYQQHYSMSSFVSTCYTRCRPIGISVVMVSKILLSVGFGRFCKKNRGFRFGFGSHNKRIVNVEAASDAVIFSHVVLRFLTMHIDIISVNQYRLKMTYLV